MDLHIKGILSFTKNLITPSTYRGTTTHNCVILLKNGDPQIEKLQAAVKEVTDNAFPTGLPKDGKIALKVEPCEYTEGYHSVRLKRNVKDGTPTFKNMEGADVPAPEFYSGAEAVVDISIFAYQGDYSGVTHKLEGVYVTGNEGELGRLGGGKSQEQRMAAVLGNQ